MPSEAFRERISDDWLWRERELRLMDAQLLHTKDDYTIKSALLVTYSHWEGHFKKCALELLGFIQEGINRRIFEWTDVRPEIRQRLLFCSYRRSSLSGQTQETFISHLNALNDARYARALGAKNEIVMIDDNLNVLRAEAICKNLGVEHSWFTLKKIIIDDRLVDHRNAIAHGSQILRSGDLIDLSDPALIDTIDEVRALIREIRNRFENAIVTRCFL